MLSRNSSSSFTSLTALAAISCSLFSLSLAAAIPQQLESHTSINEFNDTDLPPHTKNVPLVVAMLPEGAHCNSVESFARPGHGHHLRRYVIKTCSEGLVCNRQQQCANMFQEEITPTTNALSSDAEVPRAISYDVNLEYTVFDMK